MTTTEIDSAFASVAEAIRARGSVPEDVIVNLEVLRASVTRWLTSANGALCAPMHGRWIISPSGVHIDLVRRPTLRRLVVALVEGRLARRGQPLPASELIAAGWPESAGGRTEPSEDALHAVEASANRLRVALCRLRQLGLETVIVTTNAGWLIHPTVPIVRDAEAPGESTAIVDPAEPASRRASGFYGTGEVATADEAPDKSVDAA